MSWSVFCCPPALDWAWCGPAPCLRTHSCRLAPPPCSSRSCWCWTRWARRPGDRPRQSPTSPWSPRRTWWGSPFCTWLSRPPQWAWPPWVYFLRWLRLWRFLSRSIWRVSWRHSHGTLWAVCWYHKVWHPVEQVPQYVVWPRQAGAGRWQKVLRAGWLRLVL